MLAMRYVLINFVSQYLYGTDIMVRVLVDTLKEKQIALSLLLRGAAMHNTSNIKALSSLGSRHVTDIW